MVALVNNSPYPVFGFEHKLLKGNLYYIIVLKQSYSLEADGKLKELHEKIDIRLHDIVKENARWDSVTHPSDLIPYKPKPEVILNGVARQRTPKDHWLCGIDIKKITNDKKLSQWSKQIVVTGEQYWQRVGEDWQKLPIIPTTKVTLNYENAYGGNFKLINPQQNNLGAGVLTTPDIHYAPNPSGCGWLPSKKDQNSLLDVQKYELEQQIQALEQIKAPQLFTIKAGKTQAFDNLTHPNDPIQVAGFGSYTNFWQPRAQYISDELDWSQESTNGGYPVDFDMRHWQQAPADQWLDFDINGKEILTLTGIFPESKVSYTLPKFQTFIIIRDPKQLAMTLDMNIDTLIIDSDKRTLEVIWRRIVLLSEFGPNTSVEVNAFAAR